jgi:hypothetical protein
MAEFLIMVIQIVALIFVICQMLSTGLVLTFPQIIEPLKKYPAGHPGTDRKFCFRPYRRRCTGNYSAYVDGLFYRDYHSWLCFWIAVPSKIDADRER